MISPFLTMTAPNGPPHPFSTDSIASLVASWRNCFFGLLGFDIYGALMHKTVVLVW